MPRRFFFNTLTGLSLLSGNIAAHGGIHASGNMPVTQARPAADTASGPAPAALHIYLGPDSNACGITLPYSAPNRKRLRKPGLIIWLHGGMRSQNREKGLEAHRALIPFVAEDGYILASPSAFGGQEWPTPQGIAHIDALIEYIASHYAFDGKDINLVGVSDGNLGVIAYSLQGKRELHRRILISSAPQLVLPLEALASQARFGRGSWDFLQGGRDRLFPPDQVIPYLKRWETLYPNSHLHYFPEGEHDFSFYSENASDLLKSLFSEGKKRPETGSSKRGETGKNGPARP